MADLETYRNKRDFSRSPEPRGRRRRQRAGSAEYVIHKHDASRLHYDLRLEDEGVFRSWALPKGPSLEPGEKHLAVEVEDHPLDYGKFEGVIPEGYGAGTVMVWDRGEWRVTGKHDDGQIDLELEGEKLKGAWTLKRMRGRGGGKEDGKQWLMIKRHDEKGARVPGSLDDLSVDSERSMARIAEEEGGSESADRDSSSKSSSRSSSSQSPANESKASSQRASDKRKATAATENKLPDVSQMEGACKTKLPKEPAAQLATLVDEAPTGDNWFHEIKFDGYRILTRLEKGRAQLITRNGHDWSERFPEITQAMNELSLQSALLDGEVVALRRDGISDFRSLQRSLSEEKTGKLVYQIFDLLYLDGVDLRDTPLHERKRLLATLFEALNLPKRTPLRYTDHVEGQGREFFEEASRKGLEGVVSKRADAPYRGRRNRDWVKTKTERQAEFVVGGYTDPQGSRAGFGSLLIGAYDNGKLRYCGRVGAGFSNAQLREWERTLSRSRRKTSPFVERDIPDAKVTHWVTPKRVIDVNFSEWTHDGRLRHPRFRGIREDRDPKDIELEQQRGPSPSGETSMADAQHPGRPGGGAKAEANGKHSGSGQEAGGKRKHESGKVAGVKLTHPDRVLFKEGEITKQDLAEFYAAQADWLLPGLIERPLTLLRCPGGIDADCFVQKHPSDTTPDNLPSVRIKEKSGSHDYLYVRHIGDVIALAQLGSIELHVWNSRIDDLERPDQLVFDLDPAPDSDWQDVIDVAHALREALAELELTAFLRTTGGKGLHLVVPLKPLADWDTAKAFAEAVCQRCADKQPDKLTLNMSKQARRGKVFLDYLRNGRGATAVASYSVRAKPVAPVATPVRWGDLGSSLRPDGYTIDNLPRRLASLKRDPWDGFEDARQALTKKRCRDAGMEV
ncbi:DNA ligase D [Salinicola rhizosphaerae]|uniref:DNA ligase (ATP) n=1 Tax=Salinicola rhizosphaerae TaxID=1443141 RepID=A0ABQ3EGP9_9GAMM|nr:DNA ligase D [Salinicola rhizosphaerae]GHB34145.1 ATP-dependent DNA ligase [Salinicola rhizosphaerae]